MVSEKATQEHTERPPPPPVGAPQSEYDQYWLKYVYAADREKQLTVRALVTGCLIGGVMSFSNLYVGLKTGWGLGASITSAILAFGFFSAWQKATGSKDHFTILENNTMQTSASAAAYMTSAGLVSAVPALYLIPELKIDFLKDFGFGALLLWITCISLLGVVAAIPVKRKLINEERLPFPSGTACAETLQSLHASGSEGTIKAQALGMSAVVGAIIALMRDGLKWLPETLATFGAGLAKRTVAFEPSLVMIGAGALMGLKVTISMVVAGGIAWGIAPGFLFDAGWVLPAKIPLTCSMGDAANIWGEVAAAPKWLASQGLVTCAPVPARLDMLGYGELSKWLLWPGVAVMVTHSLTGVLLQAPKMIAGLKKTFSKKNQAETETNVLAHVEAPMSWFMGGLLVAGTFAVVMQYVLFDISIIYGMLAVILALMLSFVAARSTGETDITPVGAMGKVTQLVFGGVLPGKIVPNLMAANVTGGAASQVGDLLTDMKTGHLLGAKPRAQIIAQTTGILVGAVFATLAYMVLINPEDLGTEKWPAPAALTWAGVAKLLSQGLDKFEWHKLYAIYIAGGVGIAFALAESVLPAKVRQWMPSVAGAGIAVVIPFYNSFSMFMGALIAAAAAKFKPELNDRFTVVVASGVIAGETLMAVGIIAYDVFIGGGH